MFVNATSTHILTASNHYSYLTIFFLRIFPLYIVTKTLPTRENKGTESCSRDLSYTGSRRDQYTAKNNEFPLREGTRNTVAFLSLSFSPPTSVDSKRRKYSALTRTHDPRFTRPC